MITGSIILLVSSLAINSMWPDNDGLHILVTVMAFILACMFVGRPPRYTPRSTTPREEQ